MESNLYNEVLEVNRDIYSRYSQEYLERTRNGHTNYLNEFIARFVESLSGKVVFDLGCGPGRDLEYFTNKGLDAIGVDCSEGMLEICRSKNLKVCNCDFMNMKYEENSIDGIWAYTSHTVIPKQEFSLLLDRYRHALKSDTGILALGMIEGEFEGWKKDGKYDGARRYVSRYSFSELEGLLRGKFGTVIIERVPVDNKVYIHCLCKNTKIAKKEDTADAAKRIFDKFSDQYLQNTQTGIALLEEDRLIFSDYLKKFNHNPKVLDIGCGPGRDLVELKKLGLNVTGIDISQTNIENCKKQGMEAIVGDIYKLSDYYENDTFDGVWCNCSVTNWIVREELHNVFKMIKDIVKPNGYIFVGSVLGGFVGWETDAKYERMKRYNNHWDIDELRFYMSKLGKVIYERELKNTGKKDYVNMVIVNE